MKPTNSLTIFGMWMCATWLPFSIEGSELCVHVKDLSFAALSETAVTIIDLAGRSRPVQLSTNAEGVACNDALSEGAYRVDVWKPGFLYASFQTVRIHPEAPGRLIVVLPFGEIGEGGVRTKALITGTLKDSDGTLSQARICVFLPMLARALFCVDANTLGEYAFSLDPGEYLVEISHGGRKSALVPLTLPSAGLYRNRIAPDWRK